MNSIVPWIFWIFKWVILGGVALIVLAAIGLFFFGRQIYPKLLLQPARHTDKLQYWWHPFERTDFEATTSDGLKLACFYGKPKNPPARGTCLILHGHSFGKDGMAWLAKKLTEEGFAVVAFDARAHGESEGDVTTIGNLEGADAIAVMREAEARFSVPAPRIVIGQSLGAATAIRMITLPDQPMDAAVLISPYARLRDVVTRETQKHLWFANPSQVMADAEVQAGRDLWSFSPVELAPEISVPVLMLHGTEDSRFPIEEGREVFQAVGSASPHPCDKRLIEVVGAGHNDVLAGGMAWSEEVSAAFDGFLESISGTSQLAPSEDLNVR